MLRSRRVFAPVFLVIFFRLAAASSQVRSETVVIYQPRELTLSQYTSELNYLSTLVNRAHAGTGAMGELRGGWTVHADGEEFNVDTGWMIDGFEKLQKNPDNQTAREELLERLNALQADAEAFRQAPPDSTAARATLTQILARGEFHRVHGPTWWDRVRYRVLMWIFRLLQRTFGSSSVPAVGRVFVWALVAIAVIALAYFVHRAITQSVRLESLVPRLTTVSGKNWRLWMEEAQAAAARGLWRDAVHLAYWAGISFLEASGLWKPDKARTPREYLRLLPETSERRRQLSALTRNLELTWYGNQTAGPETFSETVALLEDLGCRRE